MSRFLAVLLATAALALSVAAIALGIFTLATRPTSDRHRCDPGSKSGGEFSYRFLCVSNDTPPKYRELGCMPYQRYQGVMYWYCKKRP